MAAFRRILKWAAIGSGAVAGVVLLSAGAGYAWLQSFSGRSWLAAVRRRLSPW